MLPDVISFGLSPKDMELDDSLSTAQQLWELENLFPISCAAGPGKPQSGELILSSSGKPKSGN